jgi:hypothetical protein
MGTGCEVRLIRLMSNLVEGIEAICPLHVL